MHVNFTRHDFLDRDYWAMRKRGPRHDNDILTLAPKFDTISCEVESFVPLDKGFMDGGWNRDVIHIVGERPLDIKRALYWHFARTEVTKWKLISTEELLGVRIAPIVVLIDAEGRWVDHG